MTSNLADFRFGLAMQRHKEVPRFCEVGSHNFVRGIFFLIIAEGENKPVLNYT